MADLTNQSTVRREVGILLQSQRESMPLEEMTISMMGKNAAIVERRDGKASAQEQKIYDIIFKL